ncbi:MAG TPA: SDR family NAD(P)-dependent oxidoreductase [Stackebrandtia sp.]|jgi:NAD(P)-dependent dehydrogenase (short-subunit alcohol dehydrogenase family)|uniref:SDR family NAD(P)-dependent oxidoreductase n=1 Tax=Stackebrandtia sp. TaxID=2023065 RepID=UPI002D64D3B7|nr:SDR family NAD(P)-dependent oxidoreductase [Stackebrandtia sp.]HZE40237.1 SDR family NAD(P)-dependent oxidoreductase [Stackebrandtia sp.]
MKNKVVLIAGASKGIGAVTARSFASEGASVVATARDADALDALVRDIRDAGGDALAVPTDVTDADAVRRSVDAAVDHFGRLDFAFNNANAPVMPRLLAEYSLEDFDRSIRTNVHGTFLGMKYQIPAILASGGGAIVNMASMAGVNGVSHLAAYVTGKAGIVAMTKVAALDYADQGIRVNVVAPGPIKTHYMAGADPKMEADAAKSTPMGRVGASDEVADAVKWLCSDQSSYITGMVVPIDGGQSAGIKLRHFGSRD